jgi:methyltransferase (TIGR00027 family)
MKKRIHTTTSRTAEWTCTSRAASAVEKRKQYNCEDDIALLLVPRFVKIFLKISVLRRFFTKFAAPEGLYEYVIARTKYIDNEFKKALNEQFDQILIFGAGFDTRAVRFQAAACNTEIFELDVPITQNAKIKQFRKRGVKIPGNLHFIAIDFDKDSLPHKLDQAGFKKNRKTLFILEGLLMYLQPESVNETFKLIHTYSGEKSRIVFDYIYASVLRQENLYYGEKAAFDSVAKAGEAWSFGIEMDEIGTFLSKYHLILLDHKNSRDLEKSYFLDANKRPVGRVNGTHCLVTAETNRLKM